MSARLPNLPLFIDAAARAFAARAAGEQSPRAVKESFAILARPQDARTGGAARLAVCDSYLSEATDPSHFHDTDLADLAQAFVSIEPLLTWRPRAGGGPAASANFGDGHANAMIIGPVDLNPEPTSGWVFRCLSPMFATPTIFTRRRRYIWSCRPVSFGKVKALGSHRGLVGCSTTHPELFTPCGRVRSRFLRSGCCCLPKRQTWNCPDS